MLSPEPRLLPPTLSSSSHLVLRALYQPYLVHDPRYIPVLEILLSTSSCFCHRTQTRIMSTARTSPPSSTKRLLHELHSYTSDPNPALLHLGPVSESQVLHWDAVMKGVEGSAYEGAETVWLDEATCA